MHRYKVPSEFPPGSERGDLTPSPNAEPLPPRNLRQRVPTLGSKDQLSIELSHLQGSRHMTASIFLEYFLKHLQNIL